MAAADQPVFDEAGNCTHFAHTVIDDKETCAACGYVFTDSETDAAALEEAAAWKPCVRHDYQRDSPRKRQRHCTRCRKPEFIHRRKKKTAKSYKAPLARGKEPAAQIIIPDFHIVGHAPVGSIAFCMKPYRKFFSRRPAQQIAVDAAMRVGHRYPILGAIVKCWYNLDQHDREKVLCLDYLVEMHSMPLGEFIAIIKSVIHLQLIDQAESVQVAGLPELVEKSLKRAMLNLDSANVVKETMAHLQQHKLVPSPPKMGGVVVNNQLNAQQNALSSPADFTKRLDEATRQRAVDAASDAGHEPLLLPEANTENFIDTETVVNEQKETVAA